MARNLTTGSKGGSGGGGKVEVLAAGTVFHPAGWLTVAELVGLLDGVKGRRPFVVLSIEDRARGLVGLRLSATVAGPAIGERWRVDRLVELPGKGGDVLGVTLRAMCDQVNRGGVR